LGRGAAAGLWTKDTLTGSPPCTNKIP
jgi:hypothetical protein